MRLSYDPHTDSLYVHFAERPGVEAREVADGVVIDVDAEGHLVGMDIEHASTRLDLDTFDAGGLPVPRIA